MADVYDNNNRYPVNDVLVTETDKEAFLKLIGTEIEIDKGIEHLVSCVNEIPLLLTQSSCEGQKPGELHSPHFPVPYISIGTLYNETPILEELAKTVSKQYQNKVKCSISSEVPKLIDYPEYQTRIPCFRTYLTIWINDRAILPLLKESILQFGSKLPSVESVQEKHQQYREAYYHKAKKLLSLINEFAQKHQIRSIQGQATFIQEQQKLEQVLENRMFVGASAKVDGGRHGFPPSINIHFQLVGEKQAEDLFKMLTSILSANIMCNYQIAVDKHKKVNKIFDIPLFKPDQLPIVRAILQEWTNSTTWDIL